MHDDDTTTNKKGQEMQSRIPYSSRLFFPSLILLYNTNKKGTVVDVVVFFFFPSPSVGKDSRESRAGARIFLCSLDPVKEKEKGKKKKDRRVFSSFYWRVALFFTVSWRKEFLAFTWWCGGDGTFIFPTLLMAAHGGDGASATDILPLDTIVT